jgi:hypothetical protein
LWYERASLTAVSFASEPLPTKNRRSRPGGVSSASFAASSMPVGCAKPKKEVLKASSRICSAMASTMSCRPWPQLTFQSDERPSM